MKESQARGTASGILAVLFWSLTAAVITSAEGVNPFLYIAIEHAIGVGLFLTKWTLVRENPLPELKSAPIWFIAAGLMGVSVHELTWVAAVHEAPPLEAMLMIYSWPVLVVVFTAIAQKKKIRWFHIAGCVLGFSGIVVLLAGRGLDLQHFQILPGHVWGLVSALTWSVFAAICARYRDLSTNLLSLIFFFSSIGNFAIWYFLLGAPSAPTSSLLIVAGASLLMTSAYVFWDYGMQRGDAQLIGVISFLTPVLGAMSLAVLGKAELNRFTLSSLGCVVLAIGFAKYGDRFGPGGSSRENPSA